MDTNKRKWNFEKLVVAGRQAVDKVGTATPQLRIPLKKLISL